MGIINKIFRSNLVDCPRCLGKGEVDLADIKRLKKEIYWAPGKCAYCNGIGKVVPERIEKIPADCEYLTTDLSSWERFKLINEDSEVLKKAKDYKEMIENIVKEIEHLYYIENYEPIEIADQLFHNRGRFVYSENEKAELVHFIERVIKSKLNH